MSYRPGDWLAPCLASLRVRGGPGSADRQRVGGLASLPDRPGRWRDGPALAHEPWFRPGGQHRRRGRTGNIVALLNDDADRAARLVGCGVVLLERPISVAAVGPKVLLSGWYREVVLDDEEWYAPGDSRPLGRQVRSVIVDGGEMLEEAAGPGLHRLERDQADDRWRWTAGRRPWYVPAPAGRGPGPVVDVLVDGQPAPPGPVVTLVNSAGAFLDKRGYAGDIGEATTDDGRFDQPAEPFAVSGAPWLPGPRPGGGSALSPRSTSPTTRTWTGAGAHAWRGMRLLYDPAATVEHRRSASSGGEHEPWVRVMSERNRTLTMVRNGPRQLGHRRAPRPGEERPDEGVLAGVAASLPWALASRRPPPAPLGGAPGRGVVHVGWAGRPLARAGQPRRSPQGRRTAPRSLRPPLQHDQVGFHPVQHDRPLVVLEHVRAAPLAHFRRQPRGPPAGARRQLASSCSSEKTRPPSEREQCHSTTALPLRASTGRASEPGLHHGARVALHQARLDVRQGGGEGVVALFGAEHADVDDPARAAGAGCRRCPAPALTSFTGASVSENISSSQGQPLSASRRPRYRSERPIDPVVPPEDSRAHSSAGTSIPAPVTVWRCETGPIEWASSCSARTGTRQPQAGTARAASPRGRRRPRRAGTA